MSKKTKSYIFHITIPSIQKFISDSRKIADLWAGSLMISYLMKELLKYVKKDYEAKPIYPVLQNDITVANITNVAIFLIEDKNKAEEVKIKLEQKFINLLENLAHFSINSFFQEKLEENSDIYDNNEIENYLYLAKYQIENTLKLFVEYEWLEYDKQINKNYKEVLENLADIINYRKKSQLPTKDYIENYKLIEKPNWKRWNSWEEFYENNLKKEIIEKKDKRKEIENLEYLQGVYRCSSCGEHTIIGATLEDWRGNKIWTSLWKNNPKMFNRGERLCGVCLTKRYFRKYMQEVEKVKDEDLGFPSTSEIGATLFKKSIIEIVKKEKLTLDNKFLKNLSKLKDLGNIKGNYVKKLNSDLDKINNEDKVNLIKGILSTDGKWFIEDVLKNPNDYEEAGLSKEEAKQRLYILKDVISYLEEYKKNNTDLENFKFKPSEYYAIIMIDGDSIGEKLSLINEEKEHENFSKTISKLSEKFKKIVERYYGALIYSGGDDVLALIPTEKALDCAYRIQGVFSRYLRYKFPDIHKKSQFSMSGALIYAYHKLPLSYVLNEVRKCEKKSKDEGKNRICLKYIKRSLSSAEVVLEWKDISKFKQLPVSKQFIYQIREFKNIFKFKDEYENLNNLKPFYKSGKSLKEIEEKIKDMQKNLILSFLTRKTIDNISSEDYFELIGSVDIFRKIFISDESKYIKVYDFEKIENLLLVKREMPNG